MTLADKVRRVVDELELDLRDRVVLTEAATGPYVVTPVLAALAGARVYAFTRPTRYGSVAEVADETCALLDALDVSRASVTVLDAVPPEVLARADVITNSGHLRPLDEALLRHARSDVVVPLMYEAWEERAEDLDLAYLRSRGIRVPATNERHPAVDVFSYLGELAVRQIHLSGLSLHRNRFVLLCNNPFRPFLERTLRELCGDLVVVETFAELTARLPLHDVAGIVLAAYPFDQEWIGPDGVVPADFVAENLPGATVLRFAGHVDEASLSKHEIAYYPDSVPMGHMGTLLSDLGPDPVIRLQAGGLKAAEVALAGGTGFAGHPILEWV
jgi:hypothetical protein